MNGVLICGRSFMLVNGENQPKSPAHLASTNNSILRIMRILPIAMPLLAFFIAVLLVGCRPLEPVLLEVQLRDCSGEPLAGTPVQWSSGGSFGASGGLTAPVLQWTDAAGRVVRPGEAGQRLELVEPGGFGLVAQDVLYPAGYEGATVEVVFPRMWHVEIVGKPFGGSGEAVSGLEMPFERRLDFDGESREFLSNEAVQFGFSYWGCEPPGAPEIDGVALNFEAFGVDTLKLNF